MEKGMESTLGIEATRIPRNKTKTKDLACKIRQKQTYDRDFAQSVRDDAPRARRTADVTNDKQDVPESA